MRQRPTFCQADGVHLWPELYTVILPDNILHQAEGARAVLHTSMFGHARGHDSFWFLRYIQRCISV